MRKVLFIMGGGPRIAYGIGSAWALQQMGLEFDWVIGASMGAIVGSLLLNNHLEDAFKHLAGSYRESERLALDAAQMIDTLFGRGFISEHPRLRVVATDSRGQSELLCSTCRGFVAGMSIPGVTTVHPFRISGKVYFDGSLNPFPSDRIAELAGPAVVYVLPNRPQIRLNLPSRRELYWGLQAGIRLPLRLTAKALMKPHLFQKAVKAAGDLGLDVQIIWPEGPDIGALESDLNVLLSAADVAARSTFRFFDQEPILSPWSRMS